MKYNTVGKTGISVSELCFGTMNFGNQADEATSIQLFNRCREAGINFFDTADVYNGGRSEEILGKAMADCRDDIVLTTKVANKTEPHINGRGLSRLHIKEAVEKSLKRLGTDRIDFYFCHMYDPLTSMEETLRALDDLQREGKILYPAVSNWSAWQIAKSLGISEREHLARFECIQPMYSLVKRQVEVEILPLAEEENIAVIPYSPLGGGLLSGKYNYEKPAQGRLVEQALYTKRYENQNYYAIAKDFSQYAQDKGYHPATLAIAWVKSHPAITAPIIGARNLEQLEPALAALDVEMNAEWRAEISALSIAPASPTDRSEELG